MPDPAPRTIEGLTPESWITARRGYTDSIGRFNRDHMGHVVLLDDALRALAAARTPDVEAHPVGQTLLRMGNRIADLVKERDALLAQADAADLMDVERLTRVLYDWMPDGAEVAVGFDGESRHMTGSDLARYLFDRANEYAALAPATPEADRPEISDNQAALESLPYAVQGADRTEAALFEYAIPALREALA